MSKITTLCKVTLPVFICAILIVLSPGSAALGQTTVHKLPEIINDYPTAARADYVFACMVANGQTREVLEKCACSLDVIASILPFEKYTEAEAVLRVSQVGGERTSFFRTSRLTREIVNDLRRAQLEGELLCF